MEVQLTAKEMFEKLGYEYCPNEEHFSMNAIVVYRKGLNSIYFDFDKTIDIGCKIIGIDLWKAINKQIEELGWDNDR